MNPAKGHLETPDTQAHLINEALQSGDARSIAGTLGRIARAQGMSNLSKVTGISRQTLYVALSGRGNPSLSTIVKVTRALGIELHAGRHGDVRQPQGGT